MFYGDAETVAGTRAVRSLGNAASSAAVINVNWFEPRRGAAGRGGGCRRGGMGTGRCSVPAGVERSACIMGLRRWVRIAPFLGALDGRPMCGVSRGDSAWGCRQMIGNVWEWTADGFGPYRARALHTGIPQPWFGDHKVLRGALRTRAALLAISGGTSTRPTGAIVCGSDL